MSRITFTVGDAVPWDASPTGFAQVEYLHRTHVTVGYRRGSRWVLRRVPASSLTRESMLFALTNPFDRGALPRTKTFEVTR